MVCFFGVSPDNDSMSYLMMESVTTTKKQCIVGLHVFITYHTWFLQTKDVVHMLVTLVASISRTL